MTTPYRYEKAGQTVEGVPVPELEEAVTTGLETLHNGVRGYELAADKASDAGLAALFQELAESRKGIADEVQATAAAHDLSVSDNGVDGSVAGALHRAWLTVESTVSGDEAIVEAALNGDSHARSELEDILRHDLPADLERGFRKGLDSISAAVSHLEARRPADG